METSDVLVDAQQAIIGFLTPGMVWIYFLVVVAITALVSVIILWHWTKHGKGVLRKAGVEIVYLAITSATVVALLVSVISLSANL